MAQDITYDFSHTAAAVTITINSVADTASATSSTVDLGAQAPVTVTFEATVNTQAAGGTDYVEWYVLWSQDNSNFTDANNAALFHSTKMNGTTAVDDIFDLPVVERYFQIRFVNESNAQMTASGNTLTYHEKAIDVA